VPRGIRDLHGRVLAIRGERKSPCGQAENAQQPNVEKDQPLHGSATGDFRRTVVGRTVDVASIGGVAHGAQAGDAVGGSVQPDVAHRPYTLSATPTSRLDHSGAVARR
jgi:hypothetical protein